MIFCYYQCIITHVFGISKGGKFNMAKTVVRENESLDDALRRFKRQVSRTGTLAEARKREFYVKPGLKRKLKSEAARKNNKGKR